ncbi:hypothetical protein Cs7R123_61880 [Catellatospora sp. TT07R-123]|uniref:NB-ARC domain-containing protein n=1 Tax=Catellatospora sp. TT07R-123 TaxID=2733863 RepID=UPI001B1177DF|nr:NB-ARC domain-containing protein [Catellatospora sp. TT07R-123]GHJ48846.1 hypothetical protein Cs7R123_61880 [Catellatospora sp. TT07R-123]
MNDRLDVRLTRMRMYVLIDAFERDIRDVLRRFVLDDLSDEEVLGGQLLVKARDRQMKDRGDESGHSLVEYLDFRETYGLLNRHRAMLPEALARETTDLTAGLDRLVLIRNRVMHGRPLAAGDPDALSALLSILLAPQWRALHDTWRMLRDDPFWEPTDEPSPTDFGYALHNLPLPDYDETGLIGREADVDRLLEMCKRGRDNVITITGEGGIGKTALALEVAYRLVDDPSRPYDAVLWCSLKTERLTAEGIRSISNAVTTLTGAMESIVSAVDSGTMTSYDQLARLLAGLRTLIVIDNLETVNSTTFVDLYEALPPEVRFLLTSRVGVGELERRYPLGALSDKDGVRLLADLTNRRHVATLQRIQPQSREEIVRRLRSSPLAIKWFVLAVEAGSEPLTLLRNQGELLEFCVRSVYDTLSPEAMKLLQALYALGRPVTADELVLLVGSSVDDISRSSKELTRGSLVRVSAKNEVSGAFDIAISESASQFMRHADLADSTYIGEIARREEEFRVDEERRAHEAAERSLAPIVVRARDHADAATAQLLRRALLASQADDYAHAYEFVSKARSLNPDFWEVDRVEGFLRANQSEYSVATNLYLKAYKQAEGEHRAVVAHFLAGHLSRNVKDLETALKYSREAHQVLQTPETGVALGNTLVWCRQFDEAITLIEPAVGRSKAKARLIAVTSLMEAHRRYGEYLRDSIRNPMAAFDQAWKGFETAVPLLTEGIIDRKFITSATDAVGVGFLSIAMALEGSVEIPADAQERIGAVLPYLSRMAASSRWQFLVNALDRVCRVEDAPAVFATVKERTTTWTRGGRDGDGEAQSELLGQIHSLPGPTFGFIAHDDFPGNIFFHRDSCAADSPFRRLAAGQMVRFRVQTREDGRIRAVNVSAAD